MKLPQASVTFQVRTITCLTWPGSVQSGAVTVSVEVTVVVPQVSEPPGVPVAATVVSAGHSSVVSSGKAVKVGGVVSLTVIVCGQVAILPVASVAVQVLVMVLSM